MNTQKEIVVVSLKFAVVATLGFIFGNMFFSGEVDVPPSSIMKGVLIGFPLSLVFFYALFSIGKRLESRKSGGND